MHQPRAANRYGAMSAAAWCLWTGRDICRVIWQAHAAEMSELNSEERFHLMRIVFEVEAALWKWLRPDKVNLASLGNLVPHLHWHVIPRFRDDAHFANSVWGLAHAPRPAAERRPGGGKKSRCRSSGPARRESDRRRRNVSFSASSDRAPVRPVN